MKLTGARLSAFLRRPDPAIAAVLLFGPDRGLVRERSEHLMRAAGTAADDAFSRVEMSAAAIRADPVALVDEAKAMTFLGGRRCVRVRDATDAISGAVQMLLAAAPWEAFVIVEAGELTKGSALRQAFEASALAAAVACYPDDVASLRGVIVDTLASSGVRADDHAVELLVGSLGADRGVTRSELDKLALYKCGDGVVTAEDVLAVVSDSHLVSLSSVAFAVGTGDAAELDRMLTAAAREGAEPVALLRTVAHHLQRLLTVRSAIDQGRPVAEAVAALRPPVFFRLIDDFRKQAKLWQRDQLRRALALVIDAELQCKTTGFAAAAIASDALFRLAAMAASPAHPPRQAH